LIVSNNYNQSPQAHRRDDDATLMCANALPKKQKLSLFFKRACFVFEKHRRRKKAKAYFHCLWAESQTESGACRALYFFATRVRAMVTAAAEALSLLVALLLAYAACMYVCMYTARCPRKLVGH
jgi:hypothetical protein